jgi:hypothetical protein
MQRAQKAELLEKASTSDLLFEMQKLRVVQIGNIWKLTEVTKRQKTIFEKLGISVPVEPNLVIKNSGLGYNIQTYNKKLKKSRAPTPVIWDHIQVLGRYLFPRTFLSYENTLAF